MQSKVFNRSDFDKCFDSMQNKYSNCVLQTAAIFICLSNTAGRLQRHFLHLFFISDRCVSCSFSKLSLRQNMQMANNQESKLRSAMS